MKNVYSPISEANMHDNIWQKISVNTIRVMYDEIKNVRSDCSSVVLCDCNFMQNLFPVYIPTGDERV